MAEGGGDPLPPEADHSALSARKGAAGKPELPRRRSGAAKSGWVEGANRHLNYLAESIDVNAGGFPETDVPSSRGEKPGVRRSGRSSPRPGKPATWRRAAVCRELPSKGNR